MKIPWVPNRRRDGISPRIFLSASVPKPDRDQRFLAGAGDPRLMARIIETRVRDAVTSLVAEVLRRGGQVAFGGHPAITPIVASVARDFEVKPKGERPLLLYQSELFSRFQPPPGRKEMVQSGTAELIWVPVDRMGVIELLQKRERLNSESWLVDERQFARLREGQAAPGAGARLTDALTWMRVAICVDSQPEFAVCMGGMEGIEGEYKVYSSYLQARGHSVEGRIFALQTTYGAAANLEGADIHFYDQEYFAGSTQEEVGLAPETLQVAEDREVIDRQLLRRVRYDRLMQKLVREMTEADPLR